MPHIHSDISHVSLFDLHLLEIITQNIIYQCYSSLITEYDSPILIAFFVAASLHDPIPFDIENHCSDVFIKNLGTHFGFVYIFHFQQTEYLTMKRKLIFG